MGRRAEITSARRIERERRTAAIMDMRLAGYSLRAIGEAQRPPVSGVAIFKTIRKTLERMATEVTEQIRKLEALRLDEMTLTVFPAASAGDLAAIDRLLDIMRRRSRLLGLDVRWAPGVSGEEFAAPRVGIEIINNPNLEHVRRLEERLEERGPPPRITSLPGLN
jgi:hypothetical protein